MQRGLRFVGRSRASCKWEPVESYSGLPMAYNISCRVPLCRDATRKKMRSPQITGDAMVSSPSLLRAMMLSVLGVALNTKVVPKIFQTKPSQKN